MKEYASRAKAHIELEGEAMSSLAYRKNSFVPDLLKACNEDRQYQYSCV